VAGRFDAAPYARQACRGRRQCTGAYANSLRVDGDLFRADLDYQRPWNLSEAWPGRRSGVARRRAVDRIGAAVEFRRRGVGVGETPIRVALQGGDMKIFALQKHARILSIVSKASVQDLGQIKVLGIQSLGSSTHNFWLWYARQRKLSESQVQFVHTNSSAKNYLALKSGRVGAAIFGPPFDVQAQQEGFRLLVEGMKNPQPFPATCYFATVGFLNKRPEAARRFVESMKEAVQLFHEDKTATLKVIERRLRL